MLVALLLALAASACGEDYYEQQQLEDELQQEQEIEKLQQDIYRQDELEDQISDYGP